MHESKIDRMRRRAERSASEPACDHVWSFDICRKCFAGNPDWHADRRGAQAKPIAEPGDRIKIDGRPYLTVTALNSGPQDIVWCGGESVAVARIRDDVYTKAEQEANGALVQYDSRDYPTLSAIREPLGAAAGDTRYEYRTGVGNWFFLTPEATAALGEFLPVPERDIHVGDSVRFVSNYSGKEVVDRVSHINPTGSFGGFDADGRGWSRREEDLSLVAREDPKFIAPPVIKYCSCPEKTPDCPDHNASPVIKEPEPAPECRFDHSYGRGVCPGCGNVIGRPDPAPSDRQVTPSLGASIPEAWEMVAAGDHIWVLERPNAADLRWRRLHADGPNGPGPWMSDDDLQRLGPVRRCVPVTLPDEPHEWARLWVKQSRGPASTEEVAAELLAAALHAEEGEK